MTDVIPIQNRGLRVAICVPTHDNLPAMFAYDLGQLMGQVGAHGVGTGIVESAALYFVTGTYIHSARQELAEHAVMKGADYVLWLDSDMRFPPDTLWRLLEHNEPIVGVNYSNRGLPPNFVAISKTGIEDGVVEKCPTLEESTGLEPVEAIGFGALLVRTDVFRALGDPQEEPWFFYEWLPNLGQQVGEDVWFAERVREAGYEILVDHDLSKDCGHIGNFTYTPEHVEAYLEGINAPDLVVAETELT